MTDFGWNTISPANIWSEEIWSEEKERRLLAMVDGYRHAQGKLSRIDAILRGDDPVSRLLTGQQRLEIQKRPQSVRYISSRCRDFGSIRRLLHELENLEEPKLMNLAFSE